jgi:class 3 adenylate cyclase/CHASE2 domain-containing sensor protein
MSRLERRIIFNTGLVGVLLTTVALVFQIAGLLRQPDDWLYDLRAQRFQFFTPPPTDRLVHLDIDDRALEVIGTWPWPRALLGEIVDELRIAGTAALALDVLFTEKQDPTVEVSRGSFDTLVIERTLENDPRFAESIARFGNAIVPASVSFAPRPPSPLQAAAVEQLEKDPELFEAQLIPLLIDREWGRDEVDATVRREFPSLRREALFMRVARECAAGELTVDELLPRLLPRTDPALRFLEKPDIERAHARYRALRAMQNHVRPFPPEQAGHFAPGKITLPAIWPLGEAAAASGFVDWNAPADGKVRSVPLLVSIDGKLLPHLGLSMALRTLGTRLEDVQIAARDIRLPRPGKPPIVIPVRTEWTAHLERHVTMVADIPWFGRTDDWEAMYDWPLHRERFKQHLSIGLVWSPCATRRQMQRNLSDAGEAVKAVLYVLESQKLEQVEKAPPPLDAYEAWYELIDVTLQEAKPRLDEYGRTDPAKLDEFGRTFLASVDALRRIRTNNARLAEKLSAQRRSLAEKLQGRSVLLGWIATGRTDWIPTSIHRTCPGVVAHGAIFNAIMTGDFWRTAPSWATYVATVCVGIAATIAAARLSSIPAFAITAILGIFYVLLNGLFLFDYGNTIVGLAAPLVALCLVWTGCSFTRILIETSERANLTQRFNQYVDPTLVKYVIERPDQVRLEGETRELTVVFTDLVGFTAMTERLGERSVTLLNEYMARMVPIIRRHGGYVNKFLGDGIMFFFGAPIHNPDHAADAVAAALDMQAAMGPLSEELQRQDLPALSMRIGISTGRMVVGDAGPDDASDYTVLGDAVNLGARLESANKMTGTRTLVTARTTELAGNRFLFRPVGKLRVAGKSEGVMTHEPVAPLAEATAEQRRLVVLSDTIVQAFVAGHIDGCISAVERMENELGPSRFTTLYREQAESQLRSGRSGNPNGLIVFIEK